MSDLRTNLDRVSAAIAEAAARAGRSPDSVTLVAVSKTQPAELVAEAFALGVRCFGENRVQEAERKVPRVRELLGQDPAWRLIGTLQRNKVKDALGLFAILESVDSVRLAEAISRRAADRPVSSLLPVPILLEVYLGDDPNRPGFRPAELVEQAPSILALPSLDVRGLMTVAPFGSSPEQARSAFRQVRELRDELRHRHSGRHLDRHPGGSWEELSMGMTDDYPVAIEEGATIVRVGRAIFGERPI